MNSLKLFLVVFNLVAGVMFTAFMCILAHYNIVTNGTATMVSAVADALITFLISIL